MPARPHVLYRWTRRNSIPSKVPVAYRCLRRVKTVIDIGIRYPGPMEKCFRSRSRQPSRVGSWRQIAVYEVGS